MTDSSVLFHHSEGLALRVLPQPASADSIVSNDEHSTWLPSRLPSNPAEERAFVEKLHPLIQRIVRRHLPRREPEEDLVQSVYLRVWQKFHQYSGAVPLTHWVARVAVSICLNQISREKCRPELRHADMREEEASYLAETPDERSENPAEELASEEQVNALLDQLSAEDRMILYLRHVEHHSVEQVSQITGLNQGTVKIRSLRARQKLQKRFRRDGSRIMDRIPGRRRGIR